MARSIKETLIDPRVKYEELRNHTWRREADGQGCQFSLHGHLNVLGNPDQGEVWMGQPSAGPIRVDNDLGTRESLSNTFEAREAFFLTVKRIIFSSTFSALCS